jgi:beta-N-acetylhexosaminidase
MPSLEEAVGRMFMIGLRGTELSEGERSLLRDYPFGGFILFDHNLKEPKQILALCRSLREIGGELPRFIAIDQEGGRVHRLPLPFTHFPPAAALGRAGDADLAYRTGLAMARELAAVGVNLNFAPVLDVHSNRANPVIGDRALSSDPNEVARLGMAIVRGLREGGVIPCAKHFPGHGDTAQDSHLELPVVRKEAGELKSVELLPFVQACRDGVEAIMTAHVLYPALDPDYPATLSRRIVTGLLRQELGYDGVVFSDDLEMKAISENYPLEEAVVLCVNAGVDVLMFAHRTELPIQAYEYLCQQAEKNTRIRTRIAESNQRIKKLKLRYLKSFRGMGQDVLTKHIGTTSHRKLAEKIITAGEH